MFLKKYISGNRSLSYVSRLTTAGELSLPAPFALQMCLFGMRLILGWLCLRKGRFGNSLFLLFPHYLKNLTKGLFLKQSHPQRCQQRIWVRVVGKGFPGGVRGKEPACQNRRREFNPWVGKSPWRRTWQPTPVFLPRESRGWRSLVGCSPWGCTEPGTAEGLSRQWGSSAARRGQGPWCPTVCPWPSGTCFPSSQEASFLEEI